MGILVLTSWWPCANNDSRYRFWKVTFFASWAGVIFATGWILRCISSFNRSNLSLYVAQTILVFAGPPVYAATEYNVLGRLMRYVPMHAPLHPDRIYYVFIYIGVAVESLTAAGASLYASASGQGLDVYVRGGHLISAALVLQGAVELLFMSMVAQMHYRCAKHNMLTRNIRNLCITLYGTSTLVLLRCIFRAVEAFSTYTVTTCNGTCHFFLYHEWYLYVFEAAPMVAFSYWLNLMHPGRFLPTSNTRYRDVDAETERLGPGWIDRRSKWETFVDPFDMAGLMKGTPSHEKFWSKAEDWPVAVDGSFALGTATNVRKH